MKHAHTQIILVEKVLFYSFSRLSFSTTVQKFGREKEEEEEEFLLVANLQGGIACVLLLLLFLLLIRTILVT